MKVNAVIHELQNYVAELPDVEGLGLVLLIRRRVARSEYMVRLPQLIFLLSFDILAPVEVGDY